MAIFLLNGTVLDSSQELNFFSDTGFVIDIISTRPDRLPERLTRITEVHWGFDEGESVALESDLDSQGRTIYCSGIAVLSITGEISPKQTSEGSGFRIDV